MKAIGEIADVFDGPHATPEKIEIGPYFLSISSLINGSLDLSKSAHLSETDYIKWTRRVTPQEGDLLFSYETRLGEAALMPKGVKACLGRRMGLLRPDKSKVIPEYLLYAYLSPAFQGVIVANTITGATVDRIALNELPKFRIRIPALSEQKSVAKLLSSIDQKIEINNRINAELETMAKTLYDYWFVQFDFPDENGKPYKSSGGKMLYSKELKREIPACIDWRVSTIGKELKTTLGGTPSTQSVDYWDGDIPWLNSGEVAKFPVIQSEKTVTEKGIKDSAADFLPAGSVVISIVRYIRPSILGIGAATSQSVIGLLESKNLKNSFIYPSLVNDVPRLMSLRAGAQQPHINKGTFDSSLIVIPEQSILELYYKIANPIYAQIINKAFENQRLAALRDWLLPMLMNGQVRVESAADDLYSPEQDAGTRQP